MTLHMVIWIKQGLDSKNIYIFCNQVTKVFLKSYFSLNFETDFTIVNLYNYVSYLFWKNIAMVQATGLAIDDSVAER